jgi:hypothetical protein
VAGLVSPYADAANISAQSAAFSAAVVGTLSSPPNALPYRVTNVSGGVGTGAGGVPGEYALVATGGPPGHKAYGTIDSTGKVASYRNANGGLSTGNAVPTYMAVSGGVYDRPDRAHCHGRDNPQW